MMLLGAACVYVVMKAADVLFVTRTYSVSAFL